MQPWPSIIVWVCRRRLWLENNCNGATVAFYHWSRVGFSPHTVLEEAVFGQCTAFADDSGHLTIIMLAPQGWLLCVSGMHCTGMSGQV